MPQKLQAFLTSMHNKRFITDEEYEQYEKIVTQYQNSKALINEIRNDVDRYLLLSDISEECRHNVREIFENVINHTNE